MPFRRITFAALCLLPACAVGGDRIDDPEFAAPNGLRGGGGNANRRATESSTGGCTRAKWRRRPDSDDRNLKSGGGGRPKTVSWEGFETTHPERGSISNDVWEGFHGAPSAEAGRHAALDVRPLEDALSRQRDSEADDRTVPPTSMLLRTFESASFSDGTHSMDRSLPNPRDVSNAFHADRSMPNSHGATDWLWAFGQFLNHDISEVNVNEGDFCNITVSPADPFLHGVTSIPMSRSKFKLDESNVAQQLTEMTSIIDAENVYGTTASRLRYIRSDDSHVTGRLRTSGNNLLPKNKLGLTNRGGDDDGDLFLAGDVRANENVALLVTHTLWLREHNYWADSVRASKPALDGDDVFEIARVLVRAMMQKIVYDEFLPALLGEGALPEYAGHDPNVDAGLENVVTSCAYRLGHTMVGDSVTRDYGDGGAVARLPMEESFFAPRELEREGLDPFLRGLASGTCEEVDPFLVPALRNHLFSEQFDLVALNVERARDHGIPGFNEIRSSLGYAKLRDFDDFLFSDRLASVYRDTDQIDCWIGMNAEPRLEGLMVGPTQRTVLAKNFANIRDGDERYYRNLIRDEELLGMIEGTTFADVIRRNSDAPGSLDDVRDDVFFVASPKGR